MNKPKIIIFSGPPCSGKSTLARDLSAHTGFPHLQMDEIRTHLIPQSTHNPADRGIAYRAMHLMAELLLKAGLPVIVDATYGPYEQRQELERIACRTQAEMFLIQCQISPAIAVSRFSARSNHPAHDLTPDKVEQLANGFLYFNKGLILDTARERRLCLEEIKQYLLHNLPIEPDGEWVAAGIRPITKTPERQEGS